MGKVISKSERETKDLAKKLWRQYEVRAKEGVVFLLKGELGGGKTVFAKGLGEALGIEENVNSPTFVICAEYPLEREGWKYFRHYDLYRIEKEFELDEIGFKESLGKGVVAAVEWPEIGKGLFPLGIMVVEIKFKYLSPEKRKISWKERES